MPCGPIPPVATVSFYDINECYDSLLYDIEIDTFYTTSIRVVLPRLEGY